MHTILIVEDERAIREMIKFSVHKNEPSFVLREAENTTTAYREIVQQIPDLILLDWMLPEESGIRFAARLKKDEMTKHIPIIMLTAKAEEHFKIRGLESGVDDYITKPFSPRELVARIKAVLRRGSMISIDGKITQGRLTILTEEKSVKIDDFYLKLTPIEYKLLHYLVTHQQRVLSREQLLNNVWGYESDVDERTVDVHITRLRKILKNYQMDHLIKTVHGTGYKLLDETNTNE